ncbi:MAG: multicopper oxidase domain-containing protein, partial [Betaproteobacteria bacterium]|nr:multicopper oxidase domain-containing protein [Betaproteobacteria bacterium]
MNQRQPDFILADPTRRRFVQGLAAGGLLLGTGLAGRQAWAAGGMQPSELRGTEFDLEISELPVNFTGKPRIATAINGQIPGPTLRWREGDTVTLRVTNRMAVPTSIHWHGILLPFRMDGVPGLSFNGIAPGETFVYRFKVRQAGTYWYHSHSGFQEQTGMYGAIVIDPAGGDRIRADRDYVVQLSDWTDEDPMRVLHKLKAQSDYYNFIKPTVGDFF